VIELMVVAMCLGDYRCDQAAKGYIAYNPRLKYFAKDIKNRAESTVGKPTLVATSTILAAATSKTYQIKINRYFSFGKQPDGIVLLLALTF